MFGRLGNVFGWAGNAGAILLGAAGIYFAFSRGDAFAAIIVFGGMALISWLAGRALRYILGGT